MTDPLGSWGARMATLPAALVAATPRAVRAGGRLLEAQAEANLRTASGGDLWLSRVRSGKGARVGVRLTVRGAGAKAAAVVLPSGPVSLIENDTAAHVQPFQYSGTGGLGGRRRYATQGERLAGGGTARRRRARGSFVRVPGYGPRSHVQHPGTKGKRPVARAFTEAAGRAGTAGGAEFTAAIRAHMG